MADQRSGTLPVLRWATRPAAVIAYCIPYAGAAGRVFQPWAAAAPADLEIRSFALPGRQERIAVPPYTSVAEFAEDVATAVENDAQGRPYVFFGHSMGALIAFEAVRTLRGRGGRLPVLVAASGRDAPHSKDRLPPLHRLPDTEFAAMMDRYGGMPADVLANEELLRMVMPALRADFALCEAYQYVQQDPLPCPLVVFGGREDPMVDVTQLRAWSELTGKGCLVQTFDGDHFFLWKHQTAILDVVRRAAAASLS